MDVKTVIWGFNDRGTTRRDSQQRYKCMNYECMFIFSQTVSMVHTLGTKKNLYKMYKYRYRGWDDQGVI